MNKQRLLIVLLSITLLCGCGFLGIKYVEYKHKWADGLLWARSYKPTEHGHGAAAATTAGDRTDSSDRTDPTDPTDPTNPPPPEGPPPQSQMVVSRVQDGDHGGTKFRTEPKNVGVFFSIYFLMTGLHGLHVIAGMAAIGWVLSRSIKGHFNSEYFGPVDYVGLYWHLVDLVWIYLFPLLYLIH